VSGRGEVPVGASSNRGRKRGAWEEGESDGWGRPVSGTKKKRKGGGEVGRCGERSWAGGPAGLKGKGR
jgi:hypothetical protein